MTRTTRVLEQGAIELWLRPRVEHEVVEDAGDVQRLLLVLRAARHRLIALGRKRLPRPRERFWGFVDLVSGDVRAIDRALDAQEYRTITRGVRHLPAAIRIGDGTYALAAHDGHTHLACRLPRREINLIVSVANPDLSVWRDNPQRALFDDEREEQIRTPFPPELQARFGERRYAQLDTTAWLDCEGAELIFIAVDEPLQALGVDLREAM